MLIEYVDDRTDSLKLAASGTFLKSNSTIASNASPQGQGDLKH